MSVLYTFIAVMGAQIYILAQPLFFFTPFPMNDPKLWLMRFASSAPPPHFWWDLLFPCPYGLHLIQFEYHFQNLNTGLCSESELHLVSFKSSQSQRVRASSDLTMASLHPPRTESSNTTSENQLSPCE